MIFGWLVSKIIEHWYLTEIHLLPEIYLMEKMLIKVWWFCTILVQGEFLFILFLIIGGTRFWKVRAYFLNIVACVYTFVKKKKKRPAQGYTYLLLGQWWGSLISEKLGKSMMATIADKHQMHFFFNIFWNIGLPLHTVDKHQNLNETQLN